MKRFISYHVINIVFGCAPGYAESLFDAFSSEMKKMITGGLSEKDVLKFKAGYIKNEEL